MKKIIPMLLCTMVMLLLFATPVQANESNSLVGSSYTNTPVQQTIAMISKDQKEMADLEDWHLKVKEISVPKKKGCYELIYPATKYKAVPCATLPARPFSKEPSSEIVGNGNDWSIRLYEGKFSTADGYFGNVSGLEKESDDGQSDDYTLQLNTQFFDSPPICNGSDCQGWQQFIYSTDYPYEEGCTDGCLFMQYWLLNYSGQCPDNWDSSGGSCYRNSSKAISIPSQSISALPDLLLRGSTTASGSNGATDALTLFTSKSAYAVNEGASYLDLYDYWDTAEFNVFGNGGGSEAVFNAGTSIPVGLTGFPTNSEDTATYVKEGYTGETNNLTLSSTPPTVTSQAGTVFMKFVESN